MRCISFCLCLSPSLKHLTAEHMHSLLKVLNVASKISIGCCTQNIVLPLDIDYTVFPGSHILLKWEVLSLRPLTFLQFECGCFFLKRNELTIIMFTISEEDLESYGFKGVLN